MLLFGLTFASWATSIPERGVFDGDGDRDGLLKGLVKLCSRSLVGSIMSFRLFHVTCQNMLSLLRTIAFLGAFLTELVRKVSDGR